MANLTRVADVLRELGIDAQGVLADESRLIALATAGRDEVMEALKAAGVKKVGHRLKLEQALLEKPDNRAKEARSAPAPSPAPAQTPVERVQIAVARPSASAATGSLEPSEPLRLTRAFYQVISSVIKVRAGPSLSADVLGMHKSGSVCECDAIQGGWVRQADNQQHGSGWMLIDGNPLGLGPLLKPVPASYRLRDSSVQVSDLDVPAEYEAKIDEWTDTWASGIEE